MDRWRLRQEGERVFLNVGFSKVKDHLDMGWLVTDIFVGTLRGEYAVCMEWICNCPLPKLKEPPH
jgi:hypothetical protein